MVSHLVIHPHTIKKSETPFMEARAAMFKNGSQGWEVYKLQSGVSIWFYYKSSIKGPPKGKKGTTMTQQNRKAGKVLKLVTKNKLSHKFIGPVFVVAATQDETKEQVDIPASVLKVIKDGVKERELHESFRA